MNAVTHTLEIGSPGVSAEDVVSRVGLIFQLAMKFIANNPIANGVKPIFIGARRATSGAPCEEVNFYVCPGMDATKATKAPCSRLAAERGAIIATGARHTFIGNAVAGPTESGLFSRPDFRDGAACAASTYRFGRKESYVRKACGTALPVCLTSFRPSLALDTHGMACQSRTGAEAMQSQSPTTSATDSPRRPKPQRQPDGSHRVPGPLSFTHTTTARGRLIGECHFEAQPLSYHESQREGMGRAAEMLAYIRAHRTGPLPVAQIIAAAMGCELPRLTWAKPSTANVSRAFMDALVDMIEAAALHVNHEAYFKGAIERSIDDEKTTAAYERDRHQRTAIKAAATRKARREAEAAA